MKPVRSHKLLRSLRLAAASITATLVLQAAAGLIAANLRPDTVPTILRHGAVASALVACLGLFAWARTRVEPATSAVIVAVLLAAEAAGLAFCVGLPAMPPLLRATFCVFVYGGLGLLTLAATCAALTLARVRQTGLGSISPAPTRRARGVDRAA